MRYVIKTIKNALPYSLSFVGLRRQPTSGEDDTWEVVRFLTLYRAYQRERNAIVIETPLPLQREDKEAIKSALDVSEEIPVIEKINPALVNSLQVVYQGQVYAFQRGYRLERIKEFFLHS